MSTAWRTARLKVSAGSVRLYRMGVARIAAMLLAISSATLLSQQITKARIDFSVTDEAGRKMPQADIFIDAEPDSSRSHVVADAEGRALVELETGRHVLYVAAKGFVTFGKQVDLKATTVETLAVRLERESRGHTITVTDATSAVVSGARIEITTSSNVALPSLRANAVGEAPLDLAPGNYRVSVVAPGFKRWTEDIVVRADSKQSLVARLQVSDGGGGYSGPTVSNEPEIPLEHARIEAEIPLESLEMLAVKPHRRRAHWF